MSRRALTLAELLVVMGIILLLIAVLLPAVQHIREAARRGRCAENLRQLGLAIHAYHERWNCLPPGCIADVWAGGRIIVPSGYSALALLLADLGYEGVYNSINFRHPAVQSDGVDPAAWPNWPWNGALVNLTAARTAVELFLCPSDPRPGHPRVAATSYAGCYGSRWGDMWPDAARSDGAIVWSDHGTVSLAQITDGASQTVAFAEQLKGDTDQEAIDPRSDVFRLPWTFTRAEQFDDFRRACLELPLGKMRNLYAGTLNQWPYRGEFWISGQIGRTLYDHILPPNSKSCASGDVYPFGNFGRGAFTAASMHPGGVNVLLCDGSVQFISDSIDYDIWRALATRSEGDTLEQF